MLDLSELTKLRQLSVEDLATYTVNEVLVPRKKAATARNDEEAVEKCDKLVYEILLWDAKKEGAMTDEQLRSVLMTACGYYTPWPE